MSCGKRRKWHFWAPKIWKFSWGSMSPHLPSLQYLRRSNLSFRAYTFKTSRYAPWISVYNRRREWVAQWRSLRIAIPLQEFPHCWFYCALEVSPRGLAGIARQDLVQQNKWKINNLPPPFIKDGEMVRFSLRVASTLIRREGMGEVAFRFFLSKINSII